MKTILKELIILDKLNMTDKDLIKIARGYIKARGVKAPIKQKEIIKVLENLLTRQVKLG